MTVARVRSTPLTTPDSMRISTLPLAAAALLWAALCTSLVPGAWAAQTRQSLTLAYGWNAVWLEMRPVDAQRQALTADQVIKSSGFSIDCVASPVGQIGTATGEWQAVRQTPTQPLPT